ncbi:MAG: PH domain-containing protein [Ferruginibacter sp.]
MYKKYPSRIGREIVYPLVIILGTLTAIMIFSKNSWPGLIMMAITTFFLVHTFRNTFYIIKDKTLIIHCGILYHSEIPIDSISKISETRNPLSSPAASLDRLDILYNKKTHVLISPLHKKEFIRDILGLNPAIEIILNS